MKLGVYYGLYLEVTSSKGKTFTQLLEHTQEGKQQGWLLDIMMCSPSQIPQVVHPSFSNTTFHLQLSLKKKRKR